MDSNKLTRDYFDRILLKMRHIGNRKPDTTMELFGETFATPIMTAALSHLDEGMVMMAQAAKEVGAVHWCGMGEDEELERMIATGARVIKIIKPHADNAEVFRKIEHARKAGAFAVGMDIDHAFGGNGEYDVVCGLPMCPKTKEELRSFVEAAGVPFIVKGVLSPEDAEICAEIGVAGIVVSHHHGIMEDCVPPLQILPQIVKAVDGRMEIFVDCGFESGMDVFKALALGAKAVSIGRGLMGAMQENGAAGIAGKMRGATAQLAGVMARTGYATLAEIDDSCIWIN